MKDIRRRILRIEERIETTEILYKAQPSKIRAHEIDELKRIYREFTGREYQEERDDAN